jgi:leucyl-tRNA synthetase
MVQDEKGDVMSKSKGNVVSPGEITDQWGVDVVRLAMFFFAPSNIDIKWKEDGLAGAQRLVMRLWNLFEDLAPKVRGASGKGEAYKPLRRQAHVMLARMTQAAEGVLDFNTGIAEVYKLLNTYDEMKPEASSADEKAALKEVLTILYKTIAPLAPFVGEEFHEMLGGTGSVFKSGWAEFDAAAAKADEVEIPVQVNGKLRAKFLISPDASEDEMKAAALALPALNGVTPKRVIVVKSRLVNVVV